MALFEWEKQDLCGEHQLAMSIWGLFKTLQGNQQCAFPCISSAFCREAFILRVGATTSLLLCSMCGPGPGPGPGSGSSYGSVRYMETGLGGWKCCKVEHQILSAFFLFAQLAVVVRL